MGKTNNCPTPQTSSKEGVLGSLHERSRRIIVHAVGSTVRSVYQHHRWSHTSWCQPNRILSSQTTLLILLLSIPAQKLSQCEWVGIDVLLVDLIIRWKSWEVNCLSVDVSDMPEEIASSLADGTAKRTTEDLGILVMFFSPMPYKLGSVERRGMLLRADRNGALELESPWTRWSEGPRTDGRDRTWRQKCMAKFRSARRGVSNWSDSKLS